MRYLLYACISLASGQNKLCVKDKIGVSDKRKKRTDKKIIRHLDYSQKETSGSMNNLLSLCNFLCRKTDSVDVMDAVGSNIVEIGRASCRERV